MTLDFLEVRNLRCIQHAKLELDRRSNVICGANAAGKTSLLEAIFLLGCGRSFRSSRLGSLVSSDAQELVVTGRINGEHGGSVLGLRANRQQRQAKIDGRAVSSLAELALALPVQVLDPEVHKLVEEGPSLRRKFLDWGVFHVEPTFRAAWSRYRRALQQRNAALKARLPENLARTWDNELLQSGSILAAARERYTRSLQPFIGEYGTSMLDISVEVNHFQGWRSDLDLERAINEAWRTDVARGVSGVGPHRADLVVTVENAPARERVSRGQQKMLAASLLLAQQAHRAALNVPPACLLVDDPAAELDVDNLGKLLRALTKIPAQLVVTALRPDVLDSYMSVKLFHVKHGTLQ